MCLAKHLANQYLYRIELLENMPSHPESQAYLRFLEENGVEFVSSYLRWVYLRKPASEGAFDLYTDMDSKIKHYRRIHVLWVTMMFAEFFAGVSNLAIGIANLNLNGQLGNFTNGNLIIGSLVTALGFLFLALDLPLYQKDSKNSSRRRRFTNSSPAHDQNNKTPSLFGVFCCLIDLAVPA